MLGFFGDWRRRLERFNSEPQSALKVTSGGLFPVPLASHPPNITKVCRKTHKSLFLKMLAAIHIRLGVSLSRPLLT